MRIRPYRSRDLTTLVDLQEQASVVDGTVESANVLALWLDDPDGEVEENTFVITDDDDELNPWGQAGTLDGIEGEIVGYTTLRLLQDEEGYHLLCRGAVHPEYRRQGAGRLLLVGARNRARMLATEFEFEAEQAGIPVYFEALLPVRDEGSPRLAARFEMQPVVDAIEDAMHYYRTLL
jgi:GNAT superfamily N-acetyltransferase